MDQETMNTGFDRFQRLLLAMDAGDEVRVVEAADRTGLAPETCRAVLEGLARAGLMAHEAEDDDCFVRRHLDVLGV